MRIKIHLENIKNDYIKIPQEYNEIAQAFIYNNLNVDTAELIHNSGFLYEKRKFKLFTFSRILSFSQPEKDKKYFLFKNRISIVVCSLIDKMIQELALNLIKKEKVKLGQEELKIHSIEVEKNNQISGKTKIKTLSPLTIYSTVKINNSKKTYFYNPSEKEFSNLIIQNLIRKYKSYSQTNISIENLSIENLSTENLLTENLNQEETGVNYYITPIKYKENIVKYKNTVIKAYNGTFEVFLPEHLYFIALNAGMGNKNSQGFGCIKILQSNQIKEGNYD